MLRTKTRRAMFARPIMFGSSYGKSTAKKAFRCDLANPAECVGLITILKNFKIIELWQIMSEKWNAQDVPLMESVQMKNMLIVVF